MSAPIESALSESVLIGAMLQEHDAVFQVCQEAGITEASFSVERCARAWRTMERMRAERKPIELASVASNYGGDDIDALTELETMLKDCVTTAHAPYYAQELRKAERRRELHTAARMAVEQLDKGGAVEVVAEHLREAGEAVAGGSVRLQFMEAAELIETEPPPLDPIIEGCFERGDKVELVAGSKQRKSFFLIDLLFHLAVGRDWLGFKIPKRRRVVYVNLELKDAWIHRRIRRNAKAYGISADDVRGFFRIVNARGKGAVVRNSLAAMMRRERDIDLVAVDPRYKLMKPGESENQGEGVAGILAMMDEIAEAGPAVLVVHHDSKGEQGDKSVADRGGGSGWAGRDVDAKFTMSPQRDEPDTAAVVESLCRNYAPHPEFCIRWKDHRFEVAEDLAPVKFGNEERKRQSRAKARPTISDCESHVLAVAIEPMGKNELIGKSQERMPMSARQTIRDCVDGLVRRGKLAHTPRAGNKNGAVKYGTPEAIRAYMLPKLPTS